MASHKKTLVEYKITECAVSTEYAVYDQAYHNIWSKLLMKYTKKCVPSITNFPIH